jgi:hypothetical protein
MPNLIAFFEVRGTMILVVANFSEMLLLLDPLDRNLPSFFERDVLEGTVFGSRPELEEDWGESRDTVGCLVVVGRGLFGQGRPFQTRVGCPHGKRDSSDDGVVGPFIESIRLRMVCGCPSVLDGMTSKKGGHLLRDEVSPIIANENSRFPYTRKEGCET